MNHSEKNKVKDILILSLVDSLAEVYSVNLNINKEIIYDNIVSKLNKFEILDVDTESVNIGSAKNKLIKYITNDITNDLQLYNPDRQLSFFSNFDDMTLIGQGGNGWVYKVFYPLDKNIYAIKKIGIKKNFLLALNEIRAMAKFNHKNIVRYYNSWIESRSFDEKIHLINTHLLTDKSNNSSDNSDWEELDESNYNKFLFIQMELCLCNLKEYIQQNELSLKEKKIISLQILNGIDYIHKQNYIHRDIKLSNIFCSLDNKIKIGDFGLITKTNEFLDEDVGTIGYTAPEVLNNGSYNYRADLYSVGVVFLELFFDIKTDMEKMYLIKDSRENKLKFFDKDIEKLINGLIKENPNNRLSLSECLLLIKVE
jgi:serine/threonine protein kinase